MAFPDVDPSSIPIPQAIFRRTFQNPIMQILKKRSILETKLSDSVFTPHLWYSTSQVLKALQLFIASGNQLSEVNTYRFITGLVTICFLLR